MQPTKKLTPTAQSGFTLVELSIVLVIIGLIVGGVLVGQSLIQAAKVRAQLTQLDQFDAAINAFQAKFNCLPGDCPLSSGVTYDVGGVATDASGDGSGRINYSSTWAATMESLIAWPEMAGQGMIAGSYQVGAAYDPAQTPSAKIYGHVMLGSDASNNYYALGDFTTIAGALGFPAETGFAIDSKRDDGIPTSGFTRAMAVDAAGPFGSVYAAAPGAADAANCMTTSGAYQTTSTTAICLLRVRTSG